MSFHIKEHLLEASIGAHFVASARLAEHLAMAKKPNFIAIAIGI